MSQTILPGPEAPAERSDPGVRLEVSPSGIAWLVLDAPRARVNVLTGQVLETIDRTLDEVVDRSDIVALGIVSGKPGTFIAGADVGEIGAVSSSEDGVEKARRGQSIFHRLGTMEIPTLAAIDGACLGGGLELALACTFRLATNSKDTRLGLPEVRLGIVPGFGGTQRLPRLVGLPMALDLILSGRRIDAARAERIGLVDRVVPGPYLRPVGEAWLRNAVEKTRHGHKWARLVRRRRPPWTARLMGLPPLRPLVLSATRRRLARTVTGVYPAPFLALHAIDTAFRLPLEKGLEKEAEIVGKLLVSPTTRNLTWLFGATNDAKREGRITDPAGRPVAGRPVRRAGVLGAGVMGGGIAHLLAEHDIPVRMKDVAPEPLLKGMQAAAGLVRRQLTKRRIDRREADRIMAAIAPTLSYDGFRSADLIIEAVVEDLEVKQTVLAETEARIKDDCVFATNTSSLRVGDIAARARVPERVVGLHFFNPVDRMPLVEVVAGPASAPEAVAMAHGLARRLGKTPVVVKDAPGFLVNRILAAYLAEALQMYSEGYEIEDVDQAMLHFGMPMGPFALMDQVGLDTALKASRAIEAVSGSFLPRVNVLPPLLEDGRLGVKNGRGFYRYKRGRRRGPDPHVSKLLHRGPLKDAHPETLEARLYLPMVNEAVRCLRAGIAAEPADVDVGMVLGTGFPPFRGGLLRNADVIGIPKVVEHMNHLAEKEGERLAPDPLLVEMALSGHRFYPEPRKS